MNLMLSCRESFRLIWAAEDRALSPTESVALTLHLWMCANCPEFRREALLMRRQLARWNPYRDTDI